MELFAPFTAQAQIGFRTIHSFVLAAVNHYLLIARDDLALFSQVIEAIRSAPLDRHHIPQALRQIAQPIIEARIHNPLFRSIGLVVLLTIYAIFAIRSMFPKASRGSLSRYAEEKHAAMWRPFFTLFFLWLCCFGVNRQCVQRRMWWITGVMRLVGHEQAVRRAMSAYRWFGWAVAIFAFAVEEEEEGLSEWISVPGELTYEMEYGRLVRFYGKAHADEWVADCVRLRHIFRRNHRELTVDTVEEQPKGEEEPKVKICHTCGSYRTKGSFMV